MTDTTQADALRALIEMVENEDCRPYVIEEASYRTLKRDDKFTANGRAVPALMAQAYECSMDAAMALHEALLSGWDCTLSIGASHVCLSEPIGSDPVRGWYPGPEAEAENPARAWLLAILRAKLAEVTA